MKKFLSLALLCLFTIVTYGANITIDGVIYVTNSDGTTCYVNGHTLSITELIVPETIEDGDDSYTVTSVGTDAFNAYSDPTLTLVSLPATITELKARAFHNQTNLTTIICYAETAPSVTTNSFGSVSATVYVPDESIADYESVWTSSTAGATSLTFKGLSEYGDGSEPEPTEYVLSFYPENGGEMTIPEDGLTEIIVSCEDGISVGSFGTHTWRVSGDEGSVSVTKVVTADDGKSLTVSFSSAITTAGTYSLQYSNRGSWANTVPAGSFLLGPDEVESEEMEYSFTLVEAEEPSLDIVTVIDGIAYHISNGEAAVASYQVNYEGTTLTGAITIPVSVEYEGETYNVTSIEEYAYDGQEGLTSVDCQAHITYVGKHAFYHCYGVETFYIYEETPPTAEGTSFTHIGNDKCVLYVPDGLIGTYGSQQGWADFLNYDDMSNAPQPEQTVAWEVSPEQGVTDSFSSVKITFTDSETLSINENNTLQLYKDGDLYAYAIQYQMKNNYVTYYFYPDEWGDGGQMTIEEAGTYTLTIPAKQYLVDGVVYDEAIELEYIIEGEEEPLYTVEPSEDEPLTSLSSVTFIAEGAICWTEEVAVSEVKVYKDNEVVATGSALNSTWTSGTWDDAEEIVFDTELTESGEYKVVVPAGFFFLGSWTNMNNVIELNYTIEGEEEPLYTVEPSEDEPLTSLSSVTFIAEGAICWTEDVAVSEVKVYKDNEVVATGSALNSTWTSGTWDDAEEIVFDTELTESGEYKVVVPAGFFFLGSWTNMNDVIELNYTIVGAEEESIYYLDPADGSEVARISTFDIYLSDDIYRENNGMGWLSFDNLSVVNSETGSQVTTAYMSGYLYPENPSSSYPDPSGLEFKCSSNVTAAGTYTITIPSGSINFGDAGVQSEDIVITYTVVTSGEVTITSVGYATYYTDLAYVMPTGLVGTTITAVNVADDDSYYLSAAWEYEAGTTVPAGTALVLKGDEGTYTYSVSTSSAAAPSDNLLLGSSVDVVTTAADGNDGDYYYYELTDGDNGVAFYWANEDGSAFTSEAHKAWLPISKEVANVKVIKLESEGDATGITSVDAATTSDAIYTIQGVRVNNMNQRGIYIVGGKKVLVK